MLAMLGYVLLANNNVSRIFVFFLFCYMPEVTAATSDCVLNMSIFAIQFCTFTGHLVLSGPKLQEVLSSVVCLRVTDIQ